MLQSRVDATWLCHHCIIVNIFSGDLCIIDLRTKSNLINNRPTGLDSGQSKTVLELCIFKKFQSYDNNYKRLFVMWLCNRLKNLVTLYFRLDPEKPTSCATPATSWSRTRRPACPSSAASPPEESWSESGKIQEPILRSQVYFGVGPPFFPIILFGSTTLSTGISGISLQMQRPVTSQLHGSVSQREHLVFHYGSNSTRKWSRFTYNISIVNFSAPRIA
jgi:hypothetical protein